MRAGDLYAALRKARILDIDLLLIEDVSSLIGDFHRVGQHATVGMFSVATGDDKPAKYPDVVEWSDLLLLNKIDLLPHTPFNLDAFRESVLATKPDAAILPISTPSGSAKMAIGPCLDTARIGW